MDKDRWRGDYRDYDASAFPDLSFECPTPNCSARTVLRYAAQGVHKHKPFYGCEDYPDCQSITCIDGTVRRPVNPEREAENRRALLAAVEGQRSQLECIKTLASDRIVFEPERGGGGTMLSGVCSQCGASVRVNADGSCIAAHRRECVSQIVDEVDDLFEAIIWSRQCPDLDIALGALIEKSSPFESEIISARKRLEAARQFGKRSITWGSFGALYENGLNNDAHLNFEDYSVKATLRRNAAGTGAVIVIESDAPPWFGRATATRQVLHVDLGETTEAVWFVKEIMATAAGAPLRAQQRVEKVATAQKELDDLVIRKAALLAEDRAALAAAVLAHAPDFKTAG